jgi:hypothetical protein
MKTRAAVLPLPTVGRSAAESEITDGVRSVLASHFAGVLALERRRDRRFPYPHLIYLTPLADDGQTLAGNPLVAVGKQLSETGLGFFHDSPLPHRRMVVSLEAGDGRSISLAIDLTWCRFTRFGWYESGGRFLRVVRMPLPAAVRASVVNPPTQVEYQI